MPWRGLFWVFWFLLAVWPHQGDAFLGKGVISAGRRGSGAKTGRHKDPVAPVAEAWGVSHGRSGSSGIMHFPPGKFGLHSMPSGDFDGASSSGSSGRRSKNRMQEDVPGDMEGTTPTTEGEDSMPTVPTVPTDVPAVPRVGDTDASGVTVETAEEFKPRNLEELKEAAIATALYDTFFGRARSREISEANIDNSSPAFGWNPATYEKLKEAAAIAAASYDTFSGRARSREISEANIDNSSPAFGWDPATYEEVKEAALATAFCDAFSGRARSREISGANIDNSRDDKKGAESSGNSSPRGASDVQSGNGVKRGRLKRWWGGLRGRRR